MKKAIAFGTIGLGLVGVASADYGSFTCPMMGGYGGGYMVLWWGISAVVVAFIFALIFWLVYKLLITEKKRR